ncbi:hypothetical protein SAMN06272737_10123 [Blastococcus mobilis]|uniref:Uncharacterized protein n=1 Tax=Blastococcus mobilis TaxID=1938746 RepID=A0A238UNU9_9ACTN|nr:hypothetical protein SAMN06272737_10123 [Blastococcus mobilis]
MQLLPRTGSRLGDVDDVEDPGTAEAVIRATRMR